MEKSNGSRTLSLDERDKIGNALNEARALSLVLTHVDSEEYGHDEISTLAAMIFERVEAVQEIVEGAGQA